MVQGVWRGYLGVSLSDRYGSGCGEKWRSVSPAVSASTKVQSSIAASTPPTRNAPSSSEAEASVLYLYVSPPNRVPAQIGCTDHDELYVYRWCVSDMSVRTCVQLRL